MLILGLKGLKYYRNAQTVPCSSGSDATLDLRKLTWEASVMA